MNKRLKKVRIKLKLSYSKMAKKLGVSLSMYGAYESDIDKRCISKSSFAIRRNFEYLEKCGMSIDDLYIKYIEYDEIIKNGIIDND